ncbi:MAG: hypothetical protein ACTSVE_00155 [Candidatus Helarchaeota archaeon]
MDKKQPWQKALEEIAEKGEEEYYNKDGEFWDIDKMLENIAKLCQKLTIKKILKEIDEWIEDLKKEKTIFKRVVDKSCYEFTEEELKSLEFKLKKQLLEEIK